MSKQLLRWVTIILPIGLLSLILITTDLIVFGEIRYLEVIITVAIISIGAVIFSNWVFSQLESREFEIRKRAAQLEALNLSGLSLITELDLGLVLQKVVDLSRELVSARYGALGVVNEAETGFQQFVTSGMTEEERNRVIVIVVLVVACALFWSGFEQAGSSLNLFAERYTVREFGSFEIQAAWFQSLNPIFIIALAPLYSMFWVIMIGNQTRVNLSVTGCIPICSFINVISVIIMKCAII